MPHGGVRLRVPDGVHQPGAALRSLLPTRISIQTRQVRIIRMAQGQNKLTVATLRH